MKLVNGKAVWSSWQEYQSLLGLLEETLREMALCAKSQNNEYLKWHFGSIKGMEHVAMMLRDHVRKLMDAQRQPLPNHAGQRF